MKIAFWDNRKGVTTYTNELLKYIAIKNGHVISDAKNADIIGVSLTSHYEIEELKRCRKENPNAKIVVGGHASNAPASLLAYADYVNLGQGFEFFGKSKSIEEIKNQKNIISKDKLSGEYSQHIEWDKLPVVQIGKNSYSYLQSIGCSHKCKFCLTSWMNRFQENPNKGKLNAIGNRYKSKQLYFIGNNYERPECNLMVSDATIKDYNNNSKQYDKIRLIRVGLESPSQETRYSLNKRISDDEVREFFIRTKHYKKRCNIFLIAGLDTQEVWENFRELMPSTMDSSPAINYIINYFDPSRLTPLEKYDLTKLIPINIPKVKRLWKLHCPRVVIFRDHTISWKNSTLDSLLQRVGWEDVEKVLSLKKVVYKDIRDMFNDIDRIGLLDVAKGNYSYPITTEKITHAK